MVTRSRRWLSGVLARWAVRIDPDPPITFTTKRRLAEDYPEDFQMLANAISDNIAGRISGRSMPNPSKIARY